LPLNLYAFRNLITGRW